MKFLCLSLLLPVSLGFQTRSSASQLHQRKTSLSALPVEHLHDLHQHASLLSDSSAFSFLADAAAAIAPDESMSDVIENVMEAEAEIAKDQGWWQSYINLFKLALSAIHDTIDEPLSAAGFTQTWGVSIALFTACE